MVNFQALISELKARGWSGERVAQKVGVSRGCISMLKNGHNKEPTYSVGAALVELERRSRPR